MLLTEGSWTIVYQSGKGRGETGRGVRRLPTYRFKAVEVWKCCGNSAQSKSLWYSLRAKSIVQSFMSTQDDLKIIVISDLSHFMSFERKNDYVDPSLDFLDNDTRIADIDALVASVSKISFRAWFCNDWEYTGCTKNPSRSSSARVACPTSPWQTTRFRVTISPSKIFACTCIKTRYVAHTSTVRLGQLKYRCVFCVSTAL